MIVEEQHVVTISYELRDTDGQGEMLERTRPEEPLTFLFGIGQLLPSFEANLRGLEKGDSFSFTLTPDVAYGESIPDNIVDIPMENFQMEDGQVPENILIEGNFITMRDNHGQEHMGKVLSFNDQSARIDFNHVMAGKTLHFEGSVVQLRKASEEELTHKHHHPQKGEAGYQEPEL